MRIVTAAAVVLAASSPALAAGGGGPAKAGPAGIPFTCSDGRSLRAVYGRAGPRDRSELLFEGAKPIEIEQTPTLYDASFAAPGEGLVWTTNGVEGWLTEDKSGREIARCTRLGWGQGKAPDAEHAPGEH